MCDYRGVQKVCSKWRNAGHIAKDCSTPRYARCNVFGHATEGCTEPCRKCSGSHATADCIRPKSFAAAAAAAADEQEGNDLTPPAPAPQEEFPALETESDTDTPGTESHAESQDAGDLPPPSEKVSSTPSAPAETSDSCRTPMRTTVRPKLKRQCPYPAETTRAAAPTEVVLPAAPRRRELRWDAALEQRDVQKPRSPAQTRPRP
ncbi:hypothetical protein HPB52_004464 [Rhipicephalus sanguineus]|uniref:Uncharacterized protein n=1 Tax=Rhipicephalus sanguineus TaxID=34632 RepID=A0A9D4PG19_RHISA|nr:hypothetical protein HPB52_004464 [Rhipicephalus sanguineus]